MYTLYQFLGIITKSKKLHITIELCVCVFLKKYLFTYVREGASTRESEGSGRREGETPSRLPTEPKRMTLRSRAEKTRGVGGSPA